MSDHPLSGVTVVDLTRLLPGAVCTLALAELGADVIKVEDPRGGDPLRGLPPIVDGASVYHRLFNRGKQSVALDLRAPGAAAAVDALAASADVFVESFRPRAARRLQVDAATLRGRHPRLIHCSLTGYGQSGPYADLPGHDLNFVALAGLLALGGAPPDEAPDLPRLLVGDIAGGAMPAIAGVLAALVARARTGEGASIDISMHEGALSWLAVPAAKRLVAGGAESPADLPITGREACYNVYRTADDRFLAVGALEPKFWAAFCDRIDRPDLAPRQHATGRAQARLLEEVRRIIRRRSRDEWLARFEGIEACVTPVNLPEEALDDRHLAARGALERSAGETRIRTPIRVAIGRHRPDGRAPRALGAAPAVGVDTERVLAWAGLDAAEVARLRATGALG